MWAFDLAGTTSVGMLGVESIDAEYDAAGRITAMRLQDGLPAQVEHSFAYLCPCQVAVRHLRVFS